jgi:hypothetical protein
MVSASPSTAVSMMIGATICARRISLHSSRPSPSGRPTSSRMTSNCAALAFCSPSVAVAASTASNSPSSASCSASVRRRLSSSSTSRIFFAAAAGMGLPLVLSLFAPVSGEPT